MAFGFKKRKSGKSGKRKPLDPAVVAERKAKRKAETLARAAAKKAEAEACRESAAWWCSKLKRPHDEEMKARAFTDQNVKRFAMRSAPHVPTKVFFHFAEKVSLHWINQCWRGFGGECEWEIGKMLDWEKMLKNDSKFAGWDVLRDEEAKKKPSRPKVGEDISDDPLAALINVAVQRRRSAKPRKQTKRTGVRIDGTTSKSARYTLQYNGDGTVKSMRVGGRRKKPSAAASAEDDEAADDVLSGLVEDDAALERA